MNRYNEDQLIDILPDIPELTHKKKEKYHLSACRIISVIIGELFLCLVALLGVFTFVSSILV